MVLPLLHGTADGSFLTSWNFNPIIILGLLIGAIGYYLAWQELRVRDRTRPPLWQVVSFYVGLAIVALALIGPLDTYNDELFSMHMLQHLSLMQVAAPLILLGRPVQLFLRAIPPRNSGPVVKTVLRPRPVRLVLTLLTLPVVATLLFNGNLAIWHVPAFYEAALRDDLVHELEHMMFFGVALLFWWPIIDPVPRHHKARSVWALASVFVSMVFGIAIGAILTLSSSVIYGFYLDTPKPWGIEPLVDQQVAGLVMWIGGGLIYLGILIGMLVRMFGTGNEPAPSAAPPSPARVP